MNALLLFILYTTLYIVSVKSQVCKEKTNVTEITCKSPFTPYSNFSVPLDTGECSSATLNITILDKQYHVINSNNPWVPGINASWSNLFVKYISFWWWGTNGTNTASNNTFIPVASFVSMNTGQPLDIGIKNNMPCISTTRCFHLGNETTESNPHHFLLMWSTTTVTAGNFRVYKDGYLAYVTDSTTSTIAPLIGNTPYQTANITTVQYDYSQVFDLRIYIAPTTPSTMVTFLQSEIDSAKLFGCGPSRGYGHGCIVPAPVITSSTYQSLDYRYTGFPNYTALGATKYDLYINRNIKVGNGYNLPGFDILSSISTYPSKFIMSFAVRRTMGLGAVGSVNPLVLWFRAARIQGMLGVADYRPTATQSNIIVSPFTATSSTSCGITWRRTNTANLIDTTKWEMYHVLVNLSAASTWNIWQSGPGTDFGAGGAWGSTTFPTLLSTNTYTTTTFTGADSNGVWVHPSVGFISIHPISSTTTFIPNPLTFLSDLYRATSGGVSTSASWYPPVGPVISTALTTVGYFHPPFSCNGRCSLYVTAYNVTQTRALLIPSSNVPSGISKVCHGTNFNATEACQFTCPLYGFDNTTALCVTGQPCLCNAPRILAPGGFSCICPSQTTQYSSQCLNCTCVSPAICNSGVNGNGSCSCPSGRVLSSDPRRCTCPDQTTQFGDSCTTCSCRNPAICNSGVLGNGSCTCSTPYISTADAKGCQCSDETSKYGSQCLNCTCISPSVCNSGINGNGSCSCPYPLALTPDGNGCQCRNETTMYGSQCLLCSCIYPATCNSGFLGNGTCSCPFPFVLRPDGKGCQCANETTKYGPQCLDCDCISPATCNSGINGNGSCSCHGNRTLSADPRRCTCPNEATQFGYNCTSCSCEYPATCNSGVLGNGTCSCPFPLVLRSDGKGCQCQDEFRMYGSQCLTCNCISPALCDFGFQGNGSCSCPDPLVLRPDDKGCQCKDETNQYGSTCQTCDCDNIGTCNAGFLNDGSCSCPYPTLLQGNNKSCECFDKLAQVGMSCQSCGCEIPGWCDGGIYGSGECRCPPYQYLVTETNKSCECISSKSHYGLYCKQCNCIGNSVCRAGLHGDGSCICQGHQVYDPEEGCVCLWPNTYSDMCIPCSSECSNHPAQTCNKQTGACECPNGMYSLYNTCHCGDGFYYNYTLNICVSNKVHIYNKFSFQYTQYFI